MKDPHNPSEYKPVDDIPPVDGQKDDGPETTPDEPSPSTPEKKRRRSKLSGAYYYVETDEQKLKDAAFVRTMLTVICVMLQFVVLLLPQGGLEYVTYNIPKLAYSYMWAVLVFFAVAVWLFVMIKLRYKIAKRIVKEYAPKHGFSRRAYLGNELFIAANALIFVFELAFVCIKYDGVGLVGVFVTALAVACAVGARIVTWLALRSAQLVE